MIEAEEPAAAPSSPSGWSGRYFSRFAQTGKARLVKTFTCYDPQEANELEEGEWTGGRHLSEERWSGHIEEQ